VLAINNLSLAVEGGMIFGSFGPNGSGRRPFLLGDRGLHSEFRKVIFKGRTLRPPSHRIAEWGIGRTSRSCPIHKDDVLENVMVSTSFVPFIEDREKDGPGDSGTCKA